MENLKKTYKEKVVPKLMNNFLYKNIHECPKLKMVKVNICLGLLAQNKQILEKTIDEIRSVTGQSNIHTHCKRIGKICWCF